MFNEGDRVVKYKRFKPGEGHHNYCAFGGRESGIPLGSKGTVLCYVTLHEIKVRFDAGPTWRLDPSELRFDVPVTSRGTVEI